MAKGITKPMLIMIISVAVLFGLVFAYKAFKGFMIGKAMKANQTPVFTVSTATATMQPWTQQLQATGSFRAVLGTFVTSEISGLVRNVYFHHGDLVKKDTLLVELNTDTEVAQLGVYKAQAQVAKITYDRDVAQLAVQAVSQQQVDNDLANLNVAQSQIAQEESIIAKKLLRAPFDGRLGISTVNPGDYISPGLKIVTIQALDPIYVQFTLPQQNLPQLKVGQAIHLTTNVFPERIFSGSINAINPIVDETTRNVSVEATLQNPQKILLPGIFADVTLTYGAPQKKLTLPISSVSFNPYGQIVYTLKDSGKKDSRGKNIYTVTQMFVKVGEARGDQIQIISGIKAGDTVVTSGQPKLKNGSPVVINNQIKPSDNPNPQVGNEQE
jgi:membrane fusion protein, multidrug efflux system